MRAVDNPGHGRVAQRQIYIPRVTQIASICAIRVPVGFRSGGPKPSPSATRTSKFASPTALHVAVDAHPLVPHISGSDSTATSLPLGVQVEHVSQQPSSDLPFLLYLPDIDGSGLTSNHQWKSWAERFDMHAVMLSQECTCSFVELSTALRGWVERVLSETPPTRPVYLLGEGFGGVLALQLAWDCRHLVNRLVLVNPATSYATSQLARVTELLERLPPPLRNLQLLVAPPPSPFPLLPPAPPLQLALAPMLGISPQTLLRQVLGSLSQQQPAEALQALSRALFQVEQIARHMSPAIFLRRLEVLQEGVRLVEPRLSSIPQRTLVLAGGQDLVLGSDREAQRLVERMPRAFRKVLPDSGHALLYEPGGELLPLLEQEGFYIRRRVFSSPVHPGVDVNSFGSPGPVEIPSDHEIRRYAASWTSRLWELNSPVFLSTLSDGRRVMGLEGLPSRKRPTGHSNERNHLDENHDHSQEMQEQPVNHVGVTGDADGPGEKGTGSAVPGSAAGGPDLDLHSDLGWDYVYGDGPLLFVGNHQLYAFDMSVMVEELLQRRGILMRGLAHPSLFKQGGQGDKDKQPNSSQQPVDSGERLKAASSSSSSSLSNGSGDRSSTSGGGADDGGDESFTPAFMGNMFQTFGAVRVTPTSMYRLLAAGEAVLLYPGGVREGFKRRNEKYELFWPARSEFVRMAARFGATIIPVSAVGLEDSINIVLDSDEIRKSALWSSKAADQAASVPRARIGVAAEDAPDETFIPPIIAPAVPSRFYFLFGRPLPLTPAMYRDKAACDQVYGQVRSEVEAGISYLLRKREQDPYRDFLSRYVYEQNPPFGPRRVAPTFKP